MSEGSSSESTADDSEEWEPSDSMVASMYSRLTTEFPYLRAEKDCSVMKIELQEGLRIARSMRILPTNLVYRFLRLRYLPAENWRGSDGLELAIRILEDDSLDIEDRIVFIEHSLLH